MVNSISVGKRSIRNFQGFVFHRVALEWKFTAIDKQIDSEVT